jgi:uncharacterized protein (DUF433 family)
MKEGPRPYQERIIADPRILSGKPVVRGTRIAVGLVLEELAQNPNIDEFLAAHPDLTRKDVQACLAYATTMVAEEEQRVQKLRERLDEALLASLETPAEEVTPEYLSSLRQEAKALIRRKEAEQAAERASHKEV